MNEILQTLIDVDTDLLLWINGMHSPYWDNFMMLYTSKMVWVPFYASFLYVMFRNFPVKVNIICLIVITFIIFASDQAASGLLKPLVGRMRPSNLDNPISPLVHVVNGYRGGRFGFPSSHAANAWSMTFFAMYLVRRNKLNIFLVFWAFIMCYTRMYLGVHYPGDILVGTLIGLLFATLFYYIFQRVRGEYTHLFKPAAGSLIQAYVPVLTGFITIWIILVASGVLLCI